MKKYPWLNLIYNQILNSYRKNQGHHALLFNSKWNNGEDILINKIIYWLICANPVKNTPCNDCYNCYLIKSGNHPDYYQLDLEHNTKSIGVDVMRIYIDTLYKSTKCSKNKIMYIKNVECLTDQSINILLKIIEEPPINTYFFLKTNDYMKVPETILSRCIQWSIIPPTEKLGLKWLINEYNIHDKISIRTALRLCYGSPIEACSMLKSDVWNQRLVFFNSINHVIPDKNFLELVPFLKIYKHNNTPLYWLITLLLDSLKWKQGIKEEFLINLDQQKLISITSNCWSLISLSNQLNQWLMLFRYFQKFININRELLLIYRLLNWKQDLVEDCFYEWSI